MYITQVVTGDAEQKHQIVIEDKTYEVPLMSDLSYTELESALSGMEEYKAFLEKHIPKKVVENLSVRNLRLIMADWGKYSRDDAGTTPGESQALSDS